MKSLGGLHRRRNDARFKEHRLTGKNGECYISKSKKATGRFLSDIFTTFVDMPWHWSLLLCVLAFVGSWLLFAFVWWLIGFAHRDYEHSNRNSTLFSPCVSDVNGFSSALLFSIETQHTIGYGTRQITTECPEAVLIMMTQSCLGIVIQALVTGLVFAKLSRPQKRIQTVMFSQNAVICQRNGAHVLLFRVGHMRKSHMVDAHVRALFVKKMLTDEGEIRPLEYKDIDIGFEEGRDRLFLRWPQIIEHTIDCNSPFWDMSNEDVQKENFELIVVLEGAAESTGRKTQTRSSYLPGEILWGHQFEQLIGFHTETGDLQADYSHFHSTVSVTMPTCSAKEHEERELEEIRFSSETLDSAFHEAPSCSYDTDDMVEDSRSHESKNCIDDAENTKKHLAEKESPRVQNHTSVHSLDDYNTAICGEWSVHRIIAGKIESSHL